MGHYDLKVVASRHEDDRHREAGEPVVDVELLNSSQSESVVVRCRVTGTHMAWLRPVNGALLMNVAPTGRRFEVQHIHWYKIHDGKITHHATNRDDLGMLQQLGVIGPEVTRELSAAAFSGAVARSLRGLRRQSR